MSGTRLLSDEAVHIIHTQLLPLTTVLTLSISEAVLLLDKAGALQQPDIRNLDDLTRLAKALHSLGPDFVLLKGGQLPLTANLDVPKHDSDKQVIVDVLYEGTDVSLIKTAYVGRGLPLGPEYAFACMLSTSETMSTPNIEFLSCNRFESRPRGCRVVGHSEGVPICRCWVE